MSDEHKTRLLTKLEHDTAATEIMNFLQSLNLDEDEVRLIQLVAPMLSDSLRELVHDTCHLADIDCTRTPSITRNLLAYMLKANEVIAKLKGDH